METTVIQRIRELIAERGVTPRGFASEIGFNYSTLNNYLTGRRETIDSGLPEKILLTFGDVSPDWLMTGKGEMFKPHAPGPKISYSVGSPYYNVDFIGGFDLVLNNQTINPEYYIDFQPYNKDGVMWCNITGRSMEPEISNGDIIAIKEVMNWDRYINMGETYAIVTKNELRTVKKIEKGSDNDHWLFVPVNKEYAPQEVAKEMIARVFVVLGCMKRF